MLGGLAEFERELIRARTGEGRKRAQARGVKFGRPPKLNAHQRKEARNEPMLLRLRRFCQAKLMPRQSKVSTSSAAQRQSIRSDRLAQSSTAGIRRQLVQFCQHFIP